MGLVNGEGYMGDVIPGAVLYGTFSTVSTGNAMSNVTSLTVQVVKDNATQGQTIGVTATANFMALAGSNPHVFRIDTGAAATFYVGNMDYTVLISAGSVTIGSTSIVGEIVGRFSILNRSPLQNQTTGRADVNVTMLNGSASAASALSFATVDSNNHLIVASTLSAATPSVNVTQLAGSTISASTSTGVLNVGTTQLAITASNISIAQGALGGGTLTVSGNKIIVGASQSGDSFALIGAGGSGLTVVLSAITNNLTGTGADSVTVTLTDNSQPIADADVWITSDAVGAVVVAGTLQTNSQGQVTFLLDSGVTYYLWMQKDGQNPINGQSFVAVRD